MGCLQTYLKTRPLHLALPCIAVVMQHREMILIGKILIQTEIEVNTKKEGLLCPYHSCFQPKVSDAGARDQVTKSSGGLQELLVRGFLNCSEIKCWWCRSLNCGQFQAVELYGPRGWEWLTSFIYNMPESRESYTEVLIKSIKYIQLAAETCILAVWGDDIPALLISDYQF